ncbi:hypothetical protein LPC27_16950 [Paraclostridium bifermentans]|uniref:hypothetical protein n=1 Tax=Paraclostridium bifermentans TaxID=1490 RepID=UPI001F462D98|nr:hypothetical protein [Paraclostridium bifermentans]MCE9677472.1 hypothetical protein [Paraclostridium bifermentans]
MELIETTVKVYRLELNKNEALDLKHTINSLEENSIDGWRKCTINELKKMLEEVK